MSLSLFSRRATPLLRSFSTTATAFESSSVPAASSPDKAVVHRPEGSLVQAGAVSGAPDEIYHRQVRIFRPSPPTTQSAKATSHHWRIDWDILQGGGRWENPLMGWASSADYMQGTHLKFDTKEAAIQFCEKQGYEFFIQEPRKAAFKPKNYAVNYKYSAKPLRIAHTK